MLSDQEKQEMIDDAQNLSRRKSFAIGKKLLHDHASRSFADYFQFLKHMQRFFPIRQHSVKTSTKFNKL